MVTDCAEATVAPNASVTAMLRVFMGMESSRRARREGEEERSRGAS
jgi:hypothetical protein